jgi:hypothetical protein
VKRTAPLTLVVLGVVGAVAMFLLETAVVAAGMPRYEPQLSLPVALVAIAVIVVLLAVPVWRATRGRTPRRIDPFHATRVVLLAKASALAGGLLTGAGVGLLSYLWFLPSAIAASSILMAVGMTVASILLLAAGLVAEHLCTVPPEDQDDPDRGGGPGAVAS